MKQYITLTFVFLFLHFQTVSFADTWNTVRWINDGDTVVLDDGRKVRYIGINAPEIAHKDRKAEPLGDEAKRFNASLVHQKKVHLEFDKERTDQYARVLAYVFLADGTFVNAQLLLSGYAFFLYRYPNTKHHSFLFRSQRQAMTAGRGIWQNWNESKKTYVANSRSRRFHLPACAFAKRINPKNRVVFKRKWDAYWEGYAPGKRCIPVFEIPKN